MSGRDLVTVHFRPLFGEPDEMNDYFQRNGVNFYQLTLHDGFAFIVFTSMDQAQRFIHDFDQRQINGTTLKVQLGRGQLDRQRENRERERERERERFIPRPDDRRFEPRRRYVTKTIAIKGYPYDLLTERRLFNDFYPTGFIRQVEVKDGIGYIAFDTEDDANNAMYEKHGRWMENGLFRLSIEFVEDRPMNLPKLGIPLVIQDGRPFERKSEVPKPPTN